MKRRAVMTLTLAALLIVVMVVAFVAGRSGGPATAPSYAAYAIPSGRATRLADLRGQPVLLSSWATWCAECRGELPRLNRLARATSRRGLRVIGVSVDAGQPDSSIEAFVRSLGLTYEQWRDPGNRFRSAFGSSGVPESVLLDRRGRIVHRWAGAIDPDDPELGRLLRRALG